MLADRMPVPRSAMTGPARVDQPSPFIFLSHSGADSDAARNLKHRLLASPDARAAGLKVWFDKDDLRPGASWQPQIEQAIANATAFVVYVGSKGVMNWVEAEVRVALSRANADKGFLFIPALAADSAGSGALPPFAKLYQGVRDPLGLGEELAKLLKAVLGAPWDKAPTLTGEPFVGLRSMHEEEADRFFGRDKEIAELVVKLRRRRIVAIVADSGTGKSSLAQAGLAPAFRGGMLADPSRENPDDRIWNVVTMRPRASPEEGLRTGITEAAKMLGQSPDARAGLRNRTSIADASETAFALQCDLPARDTATLLIVDRFEELFTSTPDALVAPFVELLLDLANGDKDFRILLTVRSDYFNLMSDIKDAAGEAIRGADGKTLFERLNAEGGDAILRLKRISDEGLSDAICKPLRLAGVKDDQTPLVKAVQRDISDQPSDLPLLQVALKAAWREHKATNLGLLEAYHSVGGVLGALAREAEKIRTTKLSADDQARLESIFVRLVRLGDTGGATRRTVSLSEFDDARRNLLQRLGDDEHGRLVAVGEDKAEIAHEALITQWPWLQERLNNKENATYARLLDRLMAKSRDWIEAGKTDGYVARGVERELFDVLANSRPDWLSGVDRDFVESSNRSHKAELDERQAQNKAVRRNASLALTALADLEAERRPMNAAKLALAAWPRDVTDKMTPKLEETLHVLIGVMPHLRLRRVIKRAADLIAFSPDGSLIAATFIQSTEVQILNAGSGTLVRTLRGHTGPVTSAAFRGTQIVTASTDKTARLWDTDSGNEIAVLRGHENWVRSASFSPDGARVVTASDDGTARVWDVASGTEILTLNGHGSGARPIALDPDRGLLDMEGLTVRSAAFSPDGTSVVTASADRSVRVWDVVSKHSGPNGL